jgi:predicted ester cyclase
VDGGATVEPFAALMRTYCIDCTNSHDLSVCDSIMEPDYVVRICGMTLERDASYKPSVEAVFARFPGLGLVVHELVTNGDRLVMRFSEHGASTTGKLACWAGIGLYGWNGQRLTSCRVEQDFWSQRRQLDSGEPDPVEPPHLDPWTTTRAAPSDPAAEAVARAWLSAGDLAAAGEGRIDETPLTAHRPSIQVDEVEVADLFSAGDRVAFHAALHGRSTGVLDGLGERGAPLTMDAAGLLTVVDGRVAVAHVVTDRFGAWMASQAGEGSGR